MNFHYLSSYLVDYSIYHELMNIIQQILFNILTTLKNVSHSAVEIIIVIVDAISIRQSLEMQTITDIIRSLLITRCDNKLLSP